MTVGSSSLYETYLSYGGTTSSSRSSSSDFAEALLTSMDSDSSGSVDELTAMAETTASTDSNLVSLLESVIENFDEADANEDGKVSSAEAQAYKESTKADSIGTEEVASSSSEEDSLMSALLAQIVSRYSSQTTLSGSSFNLSA